MIDIPEERVTRIKTLHAELKALKTDVQRLWKRMPQRFDTPWGELGSPLSVPGSIGSIGGTGGTNTQNTGGTNTFNTGGTNTFNTGGTNTFNTQNTFQTAGPACTGCTSVPAQWRFTVAGITNGTCTTCVGQYNGTFTLSKTTGSCQWRSPVEARCTPGLGDTGIRWRLLQTGGNWELDMMVAGFGLGGVESRWRLPNASFNCLGNNTMPRVLANNNLCNNTPLTILINPVGG